MANSKFVLKLQKFQGFSGTENVTSINKNLL